MSKSVKSIFQTNFVCSETEGFQFNNYQHSIICGSLLGDANISNDNRTKKEYSLRLRFPWCPPQRDEWGTNQGLNNEPYVKHLFAMFRDMVHPNTTTLSYVTDKNGDKTCSFPWCPPQRDEWGTNTRVNDAFIWYSSRCVNISTIIIVPLKRKKRRKIFLLIWTLTFKQTKFVRKPKVFRM